MNVKEYPTVELSMDYKYAPGISLFYHLLATFYCDPALGTPTYDKAIECLQKIIEIRPSYTPAYYTKYFLQSIN